MISREQRLAGRDQTGSGEQVCVNSTRSTLVNRNVTVEGHRTSIRLEPAMWEALAMVGKRENKSLNELVTAIARSRNQSTLTAAIRVFLLTYFQAAATDEGHLRAGHGIARSRIRV
ncbi:MAG: ribbon-helix-helix domain-containing protein [Alphaproteobacteria bacterium]|nr:ribbon-helix-helix domain-containing protein [Alphaproteobacteria bacterium]